MTDTLTSTTERAASRSLRLVVPELAERPIVGGGCCGFAAADLIADSIGEIPGIQSVTADDTAGVVGIEYASDMDVAHAASAVLEGLGYPVTAVEA